MITTADLKTQTRQDLANMAREMGVSGWHSLKKAELITELQKVRRRAQRKAARERASKEKTTTRKSSPRKSAPATPARKAPVSKAKRKTTNSVKASVAKPRQVSRIARAMKKQRAEIEKRKDLSATVLVKGSNAKARVGGQEDASDQVILIVRDSFWLQASWEIQRSSVERARAALAEQWHGAIPILRLVEIADAASANASEQAVRDIPIHGGVNNWYIDVIDPPGRYQVLLGYLSESSGKFFVLCRSNIVEPPEPGVCDSIDGHWQDIAEDYERIYALSGGNRETNTGELKDLFEDRLRRRLPESEESSFSAADISLRREKRLPFDVDAELIVYGSTVPGASVTLAGEPVRLQADGTFTVRLDLPDRRQVLPVVASSQDGLQQRTTVVAVERNTKVMEAVTKDSNGEE